MVPKNQLFAVPIPEEPVEIWTIENGPPEQKFVSCCTDPYPIPGGVRRVVQFAVKTEYENGTLMCSVDAHITTLHAPSLDTWRFEADLQLVESSDAGVKYVFWKHVRGQYSTKTRTGFFYEYEEK